MQFNTPPSFAISLELMGITLHSGNSSFVLFKSFVRSFINSYVELIQLFITLNHTSSFPL